MMRGGSAFQLRFDVGPFPVVVDPSFWVMAVVMGSAGGGGGFEFVAAWALLVFVSILVHELGHALAVRAFGGEAWIRLYSFGGLTYPDRTFSRGRDIVVSIAGPAAGLLLGGIVWLATYRIADELTGVARFLLANALWVNVAWSLVNLLPVLPLDGGHVMESLLGPRRARTAQLVSVLVGVGVVLYALDQDHTYMAILFGWLALQSYTTYARGKKKAPAVYIPKGTDPEACVEEGWKRLSAGELREAMRLGQLALDAGKSKDVRNRARDLLAWIALADGEHRAALSYVEQSEPGEAGRALTRGLALEALQRHGPALEAATTAFAQEPSDTSAALCVRLALEVEGPDAAEQRLTAHRLARPALRDSLGAEIALRRADYGATEALAAAAFAAAQRAEDALRAARATAAIGEVRRAAEWVLKALDAGLDDRELLEKDAHLAHVVALPEVAARVAELPPA